MQEPWLHRSPVHHKRLHDVLLDTIPFWKVRSLSKRGVILVTPMNGIAMMIMPLSRLVTTCARTKHDRVEKKNQSSTFVLL